MPFRGGYDFFHAKKQRILQTSSTLKTDSQIWNLHTIETVKWKVTSWMWPNHFFALLLDLQKFTFWKMPKIFSYWTDTFRMLPNEVHYKKDAKYKLTQQMESQSIPGILKVSWPLVRDLIPHFFLNE